VRVGIVAGAIIITIQAVPAIWILMKTHRLIHVSTAPTVKSHLAGVVGIYLPPLISPRT
jgi:hypothetical protein